MTMSPLNSAYTRRAFLHRGLVLASAAASVPAFLQSSAFGLPMPAWGCSSIPGVPEDHVLVVLQLGGGNDGLNTVVPFGDSTYYKARTSIAIPEAKVLKLTKSGGGGVGLHPQMTGLQSLHDEGMLAIVQGVGYPNPNRSHFKSMDIWQTADTSGTGDGWLGRYVDAQCCGYGKGESGKPDGSQPEPDPSPQAAIAIGREAPLAMQGKINKPIAFENTDLFRWMGADVHGSLVKPYDEITRQGVAAGVDGESNAGFLMRTALDAQVSSDQIRKAVAQRPLVQYPGSDLSRQLQMVASMIRAGLKTRVYYVTHGSFDTHAGQGGENGRHATLLNQFSGALKAFYDDLKEQGNDGRVLTLSFSEFGRRVYQNASQGTDHGTAAPVFLAGPMVKAGLIGEHPSLKDLDEGDLKYKIDFRAVYAGILDQWLKADPKKILEGTFRPVEVVKG
ncbi:MAG: DUF1501 domain-containing protein [Phycisphaerales bacterium]|nr:DUF1501 domain-containing protein [Phycisphaerales bacterium]